uniref:Uncharacterized protein n=1 Tax=Cannabis sativa TaxID=3483 RepID=A0A803Q7E1_CANSA
MSEVLQDLHNDSLFGFDQEIFELHIKNKMSNNKVPSHATPNANPSSAKESQKLVPLDVVMEGPVPYKKYSCRSNDWEADELHSSLTCAHQLEKIVAVNGIKPSNLGVYHQLPRDEETPNHNFNDFGV